MPSIQIRELAGAPQGPNAAISFDHGPDFLLTLSNPVGAAEEKDLEWYFEEHLRFPFVKQKKAEAVAVDIPEYGRALFRQVFADRSVYTEYRRCLAEGIDRLRFEIVGSPEFNAWHWEALHDPDLPQPFALEAPMVRKNRASQPLRAEPRPSPTINLLVVTARPHGGRDVGYRTISRPLVETLRQSRLPVNVELVRPGTYEALVRHLDQARIDHGVGYYHVVHFDVHGAVLGFEELQQGGQGGRHLFQARFGRPDLKPYPGLKGFLFLESGPDNRADPVVAEELAQLLLTHQVPIVILNACQSGKQVGAQETSLGEHLMRAGARQVLAMAYSISVSAAESLMRALYQRLFEGRDVARALCGARAELWNRKTRRAYFDQEIDLEDWLLPVLYEDQPVQLAPRGFTPEESRAWDERQGASYVPPALAYGFLGRDLDILEIERRILTHNLLLIRGMGGAGKTTLLHHLGHWWQITGLVEEVFYFGYDAQAWTCQQLFSEMALRLLGKARYYGEFEPLSPAGQRARLARELNGRRHLLILDNLESITGAYLAIPNTLPPEEQRHLREFLAALSGGKTLVLLGSRGGEAWLAPGTFGDAVHDLAGLDPEAASALAERVLERHRAGQYRGDPDLADLLKLLAGYPLPIEVVLSNLPARSPADVLAALRAGNVDLDQGDPQKRTESILGCIDYAYSNLAPERQQLLLCLAPFASVLFVPGLPQYSEALRRQKVLADLPFDDWEKVLDEAAQRGLLGPHPDYSGYLNLQPVLPFFLRGRLNAPAAAELKAAVETAFREHYDGLVDALYQLLKSREPQERQIGQIIAGLEYENLYTTLQLALTGHESIFNPYATLSGYIDATHDEKRGLILGETVLDRLAEYPAEKLSGPLGLELVGVIDDIAKRQFLLRRYAEAEASYRKALDILESNADSRAELKGGIAAGIWHQLGIVAQEQRQWTQAENYYRKALALFIEFNDRHSQAGTYHQLGRVAQEQRQWAQAEDYYRKALAICVEFNDRHTQASTYHQLGSVAEEQRQWAQAEDYYRKALEIFVEFNDRHTQASTYHQLGSVAQKQQQWAQAEDYYRKALALKIEFNDRHTQASTYHQLGSVALKQRQWAQAEDYYRKALALKIEFNDHYSQASTYHQLGWVAENQRQWAQAGDYYLKSLAIVVEFQDEYRMGFLLNSLARLWKTGEAADLPGKVAEVLGMTAEEVAEVFEKLTEEPPDAGE
jgi:tetratricopeptide (TPR) repeat protein